MVSRSSTTFGAGVPRTVLVLTLGALVAACSDVGDDATPHPLLPFMGSSADAGADASVMTDAGDDASSDGAGLGDDAAADSASPGEAAADGATGSDAAADDAEDAPPVAADAPEEAQEGAEADAGTTDATTLKDAAPESAADGATLDATADAPVDATTASDAGGSLDSTVADAGVADTSTGHDAGGTGQDGGDGDGDSGGGLVPCTTAGQQGCVQCAGNSLGNLCTPTEALIVEYDIRKGFVTAPGPDGDVTATGNSCYACLVNSGYIDDDLNGDTGHECGDLPAGTYTAGNGYSGQAVDICLADLACILETDCSAPTGTATIASTFACYCGPGGGAPTECESNGPATNGVCKTQIVNGLPAQPNDALTISDDFNTPMYPSGLADNIFVQAQGVCNQCLQ